MARLAFGKEILCDRIQQSVSPCIFVLLRTKAPNLNPSSRGQSHKMARRNLLPGFRRKKNSLGEGTEGACEGLHF